MIRQDWRAGIVWGKLHHGFVIPAKAGIQGQHALSRPLWIPAFAGMTAFGFRLRPTTRYAASMQPRTRKLIGTVVLLLFLAGYATLAAVRALMVTIDSARIAFRFIEEPPLFRAFIARLPASRPRRRG